ncbi:hypothetical protein diail_1626 [Diaporthe ilicicola]|nr:hypothetical protein diail_1626 [Diaporthe ilicicola]
MIKQKPEFALLLFSDQVVVDKGWGDFPTSHELTRAFSRLVSAETPPARVAMMIDGLDEYEAPEEEQFELARILKEAGRSKYFKVVVSSRLATPFEKTLGDCDRLRLHDLTRKDHRVYIADALDSHWRIDFLVNQATDGGQAREYLIDCAVEKSEGTNPVAGIRRQSLH